MAQAVALAARAADLEQVGEVGGEDEAEPQALRRAAEVAHRQALVAGRLPQEAHAAQMHQVVLEHQPSQSRRRGRDW